jgi:exosome complex component RRP45
MRLSALRLNDQLSTNEKQFVHAAAHRGLRLDGRHISAPRPCALVVKRVSGNQSLAEATIGSTRVSAVVSAELTLPFPDRPSEGFLHVTAEVMPCASPSALNASANQELQIVEKSLKDSRAIDVEGLCVVAGSRVWAVKCQIVGFARRRATKP